MNPKSVLVAEDNADLRAIFTTVFRHPQFTVHAVEDGQAAVDYLRESGADVMILDLNMPRLSGMEVLRIVRELPHLKNLKVIVVTGNHLLESAPEVQLADMFLIKPVDVMTLTHFAERLSRVN